MPGNVFLGLIFYQLLTFLSNVVWVDFLQVFNLVHWARFFWVDYFYLGNVLLVRRLLRVPLLHGLLQVLLLVVQGLHHLR